MINIVNHLELQYFKLQFVIMFICIFPISAKASMALQSTDNIFVKRQTGNQLRRNTHIEEELLNNIKFSKISTTGCYIN